MAAKDVLTKAQLERQLKRQSGMLEDMKEHGRSAADIRKMEKLVETTRRRLERAREADYDEEISEVQKIGG